MDRVFDLGCKQFLEKMQNRKILFLPRTYVSSGISIKTVLEMGYIEAVIQAQYAIDSLRAAEKDRERYYSKVDSR